MSDITLTASMRANLLSLMRTGNLLDQTQRRIASGLKVLSALDGPVEFFTAKGLTDRASDFAVLKDTMGQSISGIQTADTGITSIAELVEQAKALTTDALASTSTTERKKLSLQYEDLRGQIDKLAADADFNGTNLLQGRGVITGGAFLDTTAAAETALGGVAVGGIARTGTDTDVGEYVFKVQEKINNLNTVIAGTNDISVTVQAGNVAVLNNSDSLEFFIDGSSIGVAAIGTAASETGAVYAAKINALSADLTASVTSGNGFLNLTVAEGKVLEVREKVAVVAGALLADLGISAGLQNDTTGAQVVDLTSDLGIFGSEVYAHVSGYADNSDSKSVVFTLNTDSSVLTVADGTTGATATINTSVFSAPGTDTLSVGDLVVNFVTTLSTEQANTAPSVVSGPAAVKQVSTVQVGTTSQVDTITVSGVIEKGDVFNAVIEGDTYTATAAAGDTAANVATRLATAIGTASTNGASLASAATVSGAVITLVALTPGSALAPVTAKSTTNRVADNTQAFGGAVNAAGTASVFNVITSNTFAGAAATATDTIKVTLDTSGMTNGVASQVITFTSTGGETFTQMAQGLVDAINNSTANGAVTASLSGGATIVLTADFAQANDITTATFAETGGGLTHTAANTTVAGVAGVAHSEDFTVSGTVEVGDTFNFTLNPGNLAVTGANVGPLTVTAVEGDTVTTVANKLKVLIDGSTLSASVSTSVTNGVITVTEKTDPADTTFNAPAAFTKTVSAGERTADNTQNLTVATTTANGSSFGVGDELTVTVNGTAYKFAQTGATASAQAALTNFLGSTAAGFTDLKDKIEKTEGVTITSANGLLTLTSKLAGNDFSFAATQSVSAGNAESALVVTAAATANVVQTATITIPTAIDDGDKFTLAINGTSVTYTATAADFAQATAQLRANAIATGLVAALNANTTLVNGTAGILTTVTTAANVITVTENAKGTVLNITGSALDAPISFGNGAKKTSTQATLKSIATGIVTGDARVKVTSKGVTETVNINTDSAKTVTISNAAFGSSFLFKADDTQIKAGETATVSVTNPTGKGANDLTVTFNTDGSASINVQAVNVTSSGLSINKTIGDFATDTNINAAVAEIDKARDSLRDQARQLATVLGVIQTREDFTAEFINTLRTGADKLTLADANTEAANMLALQTRQQLGIQALSLASQAEQSVLALFR